MHNLPHFLWEIGSHKPLRIFARNGNLCAIGEKHLRVRAQNPEIVFRKRPFDEFQIKRPVKIVKFVPDNRMAKAREMRPNLVLATREKFRFDNGKRSFDVADVFPKFRHFAKNGFAGLSIFAREHLDANLMLRIFG